MNHRELFLSKLWVHNRRLFYLEDFLKFQYFIPLICCNQVCHRQDFRIIFVSAALSWQSQRVISEIQEKKKKKDQVCHIRLCFLPIKRIDLRLHKHVGQYQVSIKQANCKIRNKPHLYNLTNSRPLPLAPFSVSPPPSPSISFFEKFNKKTWVRLRIQRLQKRSQVLM